ncbi:MAG: hypothetical protein KIT09_33865 [Bryobacteraceae bacterium]|nr:hypothetical protein [Bryobacteraceae bacterium]
MRLLIVLLGLAVAYGQKPVVWSGGVVNAASYATGGPTGVGVTPGSLVSIFGANLALATESASGFPLPTALAGSSVSVNGIPAPLLYVSPAQINLQLPSQTTYPLPFTGLQVVVSTPAGASEPAPVDVSETFGIFTADGEGCGQAAALNVASNGALSVNSSESPASPGDFISVFGTGIGGFLNPPPDGSPALTDPLSPALSGAVAIFDLAQPPEGTPLILNVSWVGRAPGFAGVDQVNVRIPDTIREGCAVPLAIIAGGGSSQPATISIHDGGGPCVDPPIAGFGELTWERVVTSGTGLGGESETFTAAFPASPGKQAPPSILVQEGGNLANVNRYFGPSCPMPGYRNLEAGKLTIQGPEFGPMEAAPSLVEDQRVYRAVLPNGTIRPGSFSVTAGAGSNVGPFESNVRIGSGINVTSSFPPGTNISSRQPLVMNWTGGDPDTWVTMRVVRHIKTRDNYSSVQVRTSSGTAILGTVGGNPGFLPGGPGPVDSEIILVVTPDPDQVPAISASGLALGGRHLWKYTYRFGGLTIQ